MNFEIENIEKCKAKLEFTRLMKSYDLTYTQFFDIMDLVSEISQVENSYFMNATTKRKEWYTEKITELTNKLYYELSQHHMTIDDFNYLTSVRLSSLTVEEFKKELINKGVDEGAADFFSSIMID